MLSTLSLLAVAVPLVAGAPAPNQPQGGSVCSNGNYQSYGELCNYNPAAEWCSSHYPVQPVTVTATAYAKPYARDAGNVPVYPTSVYQSIWSKMTSEHGQIISTACSCIQTPKTVSNGSRGQAPYCETNLSAGDRHANPV